MKSKSAKPAAKPKAKSSSPKNASRPQTPSKPFDQDTPLSTTPNPPPLPQDYMREQEKSAGKRR
jgi:hypothetical protein